MDDRRLMYFKDPLVSKSGDIFWLYSISKLLFYYIMHYNLLFTFIILVHIKYNITCNIIKYSFYIILF